MLCLNGQTFSSRTGKTSGLPSWIIKAGPHAHENAEQLFIILKGEMRMKTDRGEARLKQGQTAFIYPGEVHENCNVAEGTTE